eukprot:4059497-Lingulodinium_polyedra.AAC.1
MAWSTSAAACISNPLRLPDPAAAWSCRSAHARIHGPTSTGGGAGGRRKTGIVAGRSTCGP